MFIDCDDIVSVSLECFNPVYKTTVEDKTKLEMEQKRDDYLLCLTVQA